MGTWDISRKGAIISSASKVKFHIVHMWQEAGITETLCFFVGRPLRLCTCEESGGGTNTKEAGAIFWGTTTGVL